ncbi:magnesium transporter CorA family protein [Limnohabitans sp. yimb22184]|uniref:magnesium transporter CorA family protein n=1 Tax=Limnohabitans sp. YIMB22184 TaxID=3374104 RepID=UPI003A852BD7
MRVFSIAGSQVQAWPSQDPDTSLPRALPEQGFLWLAFSREHFERHVPAIQACLHQLTGQSLVDLHVSDLLNGQLPSRYDFTSHYDLLVFRRLAQSTVASRHSEPKAAHTPSKRPGPPILQRIDTSPVGFAVFDKVLLSVHPDDCAVREAYASRLLNATGDKSQATDSRSAGARGIPLSPADMMLRIVSQMVDAYLDLRRELSRQLDHWQAELLHPGARFRRWDALLQARLALHQLEDLCDDQHTAMLNWNETLDDWVVSDDPTALREHELLRVRCRDVLEHIDRVVHHVRRLEHNTETAVQMHFNAQGNRTNDIMRTLTALTAIFLPLNLIAAVFGMNFEFIPWLHTASAFWWTLGGMGAIATTMGLVFWRKRYLARTGD